MLKLTAFQNDMTVDIVPLFETVDDLICSAEIMEKLYSNKEYRKHVENRNNKIGTAHV